MDDVQTQRAQRDRSYRWQWWAGFVLAIMLVMASASRNGGFMGDFWLYLALLPAVILLRVWHHRLTVAADRAEDADSRARRHEEAQTRHHQDPPGDA